MRMRHLVSGLALVAVTAVITAEVAPQDKPKAAAAPDQQAMMDKWLKYSTPGESHRKLDAFVGVWETNARHWGQPGAEPEETYGNAKFEWILGGRFVAMEINGEAMGQPFEGMGVIGYDNFRREYVLGWIDSMNTSLAVFKGQAHPGDKGFTFTARLDDPMSGRKDVSWRSVMSFVGPDKIVENMYGPGPDGKEFKALEVTYTRIR